MKEEFDRLVRANEIINNCVKAIMTKSRVSNSGTKLNEALKNFPVDRWREIVEKQASQQAIDIAKEADVQNVVTTELSNHLNLNQKNS